MYVIVYLLKLQRKLAWEEQCYMSGFKVISVYELPGGQRLQWSLWLAPDLLAQPEAVLQGAVAIGGSVLEGHGGEVGGVGGQAEAVGGGVGPEGVGGLEAVGEVVDAGHGLVLAEADGLLALGLGGADHLGPEGARLRDDPGVLGGRGGQGDQAAEQEGLHGGCWLGGGQGATGC